MKISDIPYYLRPREKAMCYGIEKLNDQELLALIIGSGVRGYSAVDIANELLKTHGNSLELLAKSTYESLQDYQGLKKSIALRLLATFEFNRRLNSSLYKSVAKIEDPGDVYKRYQYLENFDQEVLIILMLDSKMKIIKEKMLYKGTKDSFSIDVREVVQEVILAKAKLFILIHNHPDGNKDISKEDLLATKMVQKSSNSLGIKLVDHIVIFKGGYSSILMNKNETNESNKI